MSVVTEMGMSENCTVNTEYNLELYRHFRTDKKSAKHSKKKNSNHYR